MATNKAARGAWGSRIGFILAASGSAVGLGNVWKFPYITGENGGGLFVLIYLVCIALVGLPIMVAELMIGRAAQKQPVLAFQELEGKKTGWSAVGALGIVAGFVILSYYIVVAGWAADYCFKSLCNFTKPIHERAETEATVYRATASLDEMRTLLVEQKTKHDARHEVSIIDGSVPAKVKALYARYEKALAEGGQPERLLGIDGMKSAVSAMEALTAKMVKALEAWRRKAIAHYAAVDEESVLDEAEATKRREFTARGIDAVFHGLAADGWASTFWAALVMLVTVVLVGMGVSSGIERLCKVLMPLLVGMMVCMVIYGMTRPGFGEALSFVFKPDPSKLKPSGVLEALGHAFFTLSLGMGAMITYGSYQKTKDNLISQSLVIAGLDTLIALLACMLMFPIIFSYGGAPNKGPGLVFMSMPLAFAEMGKWGLFLSIAFFGLIVFAALTSSVSLLEVVASYFIDSLGWTRRKAASVLGLAIFLLGTASAFAGSKEFFFESWSSGYGKDFLDSVDFLASNWLLPMGGLLIAIYAGWIMPKRIMDAELEGTSPAVVTGFLFLLRFVAPLLVFIVLLQKAGFIDVDDFFYKS